MMHLNSEQAKIQAKIMGIEGSEQPSGQVNSGRLNGISSGSSNSVSQGGRNSRSGSVGSISGQPALASAAGQTSPGDQGQTAYEVTKTEAPSSQEGILPIATILGVLLITGLIGVGFFKGSILSFLGFAKK